MSKEKFGFSTLSRLLGKKNKDKNTIKTPENNTSQQQVIVNNNINNSNNNSNGNGQYGNQIQHIIQHNNTISPLHAATNNAPFEQTFRITVLLPRDQLYVARLGARAKLKQLMQIVCENKLLAEDQYEFRDPIDSSQIFDMESTIGTVGLSEIRLWHKNEQNFNNNFNSDEILKLKNQTSITGRHSVTSSEPSSKNSIKIISKASPYSSTNSLNSMDSSGMHANYTSQVSLPPQSSTGTITTTTTTATGINKRPVAPMRKKRVAPRPPSQISVPEKEILPSTTDWKRPNQKYNSNDEESSDNSVIARTNSLQRKEFSSSTPNLNSNGSPNLQIYGEIDLHESSKSIDCNGNNQTSQKNYNYTEHNGMESSDTEEQHKKLHDSGQQLDRNIIHNNRLISNQYGNTDYNKHYFGSVQNVTTTPISKTYDSGSYLSLDHHQFSPDYQPNNREFPKPSPRKTINIKKKTIAPAPPPPRTLSITQQPLVAPRETITKIHSDNSIKNLDISDGVTTIQNDSRTNMLVNEKDLSDKQSIQTFISYDGSQTSDIYAENGQRSRSASTISMSSQCPSILEEQLLGDKKITKRDKDMSIISTNETKYKINSDIIKNKNISSAENVEVDEATIICIPAPPTFADTNEERFDEIPLNSSNVPTVEITIEKNDDYKNDTDLVTEAFKDIESIPDETTEIIEEFKMEEIIEIDVKPPTIKDEVKEDIIIINSDTEDGYRGNKNTATTTIAETTTAVTTDIDTKMNCNKLKETAEQYFEHKKDDNKIEKSFITTDNLTEPIKVIENDNFNNTKTAIDSKLNDEEKISLKRESINNIDKLIMPDVILRTESENSTPITPPPTPATAEITPSLKSKTNDRLYENRVTLKLSNSIKFRKSIGRSDSFHATRHYQSNGDYKNSNLEKESSSDSRSLSFLSLLAAQREEIRIQNTLQPEYRKLENRKSTSDLRIGELPNLQSLIVMKSILNSQNNLNKLNDQNGNVNGIVDDGGRNEFNDLIKISKQNGDQNNDNNNIKKLAVVLNDHNQNQQNNNDDIPKISSILKIKKDINEKIIEEHNSGELLLDGDDGNGDVDDSNTRKWKYQGKPNINLSTWNERPKHCNDVTIKNEGDYIFGGANVKRTSSISKMARNRMSLPATTFSTSNASSAQITTFSSDYKRQNLPEVKLRKVTEENNLINSRNNNNNNNNHSNTNEFPDFRSTLRKSENSAKLYSQNENHNSINYITNGENNTPTEYESSHKSFQEKSKSFGPTIARKTTGPKESIIMAQKPIKRDESNPIENNFRKISTNSDYVMSPPPIVKMQINEKALYDSPNNKNSNHRNSMPIIRPILIKQNFNLNIGRKPINSRTTLNNGGGSVVPSPPPPLISSQTFTTNTTKTSITHTDVEGDSKSNFLAEIQKFDKNTLKRV